MALLPQYAMALVEDLRTRKYRNKMKKEWQVRGREREREKEKNK